MPSRFYSSVAQQTTLVNAITASTTTIQVASTTGFPGSTPFTLAIDYGAGNEELVDVTLVAALNLTVTRGVDGTSATSHNPGAVIRHVSSGRDFAESRTHEDSSINVHGVTGVGNNVVGTTSTQTLSNKTLNRATGTLERVDIFNTGSWVTAVIGDSANPTLSRLHILDNEVNLQEMAVFTANGALFLYKKAAEADNTYRLRMTDSDTTTDRFALLAGGTATLTTTSTATFPTVDVISPDLSITKKAMRVAGPSAANERFTIFNSGQVDIRVQDAARVPLRVFAANPGPQTTVLQQWVDSSNNTVAQIDQNGGLTLSGVGQSRVALKSADTSRSNTVTATDDPHLTLSVVANATYVLDGWLKYFADPTPDFKMTFSTPTGTLGEWHALGAGSNTAGQTTVGYSIRTEANDVNQERNYYGTSDSNVGLQLKGTFRVAGTAGSIAVQWAQGSSSATATTVFTDSWIRLQRVA